MLKTPKLDFWETDLRLEIKILRSAERDEGRKKAFNRITLVLLEPCAEMWGRWLEVLPRRIVRLIRTSRADSYYNLSPKTSSVVRNKNSFL